MENKAKSPHSPYLSLEKQVFCDFARRNISWYVPVGDQFTRLPGRTWACS